MNRSLWRWAVALVLLASALVLPRLLGPYGNFILASILVYSLVSLSLTILIGFAGQISIGHAGFWAIGAYTSALLVVKLGVPFLMAVVAAGAVAAAFGALVALPALRVQGHYLAIATLAFALIVQQVLFEWETLTGGRQGLFVPRPSIAGYELSEDSQYVYLLMAIAALLAWMTENLRRSHTGQALMALRMSTVAAEAAGVNRARHIITAFALSAFFTGISGALYAHLIGFLSTDSFTLTASLSFLTMAVIGGLGSYVGALLGAAYLALAPELFREAKNAQMVLYGLTLIVCVRFLPGGLASLPERLIARRRRSP
jgi:branched-chain amino acid transport system permease protein